MKAKGRTSGLGPSGSALRAQQRENDKKRKERIANQVRQNQKIMYGLAKIWEEERKQSVDDEKQVNSSSLAAALKEAFDTTKRK